MAPRDRHGVRFSATPDFAQLESELRRTLRAPDGGPLPPAPSTAVAKPRHPSILAHALSGVLGSIMAETVLFPVEKVRLIVQTAPPEEALGFLGTLLRVAREQGVAGFYKGLGSSVLKESVHSFNFWCWHDIIFRTFSKGDNSRTSTGHRLVLNLVIKHLNWLCTVPFEVISTVNQTSGDGLGFVGTAVKLYKIGGLGYFYRGLGISLTLAINPAMCNTLITTFLRLAAVAKMWAGQDRDTAREHSPFLVGLATGVAKALAIFATYPLIRAKVLQQTTTTLKQQSPLAIWRSILQVEGPRGLWRGVLALTYKAALWNAFMMTMKSFIQPKRPPTPPATPPVTDSQSAPWMARDAFNEDLVAEKLDEILDHVRGVAGRPDMNRVKGLEDEVVRMRTDIAEVKGLLQSMLKVAADGDVPGPDGARGPRARVEPRAPAGGEESGIEELPGRVA